VAPDINSLAGYLRLTVPPWLPHSEIRDNWQISAWEQRSSAASCAPADEERL
jgi:hypothetical protein